MRKRSDFLRIQSSARCIHTPHFILLVGAHQAAKPAHSLSPPPNRRLGVVTTRKLGNAVQRNRIKRICRECFRQWPSFLPAGTDLVVIARKGADQLSTNGVKIEWQAVRNRLEQQARWALSSR
ncbi:ribonuclease P protein component [Pajaroellobacter abortibovis]|uniref:ribonuclease P protein component n=1 Tax=Pajaroellobacter abortibovis TaxID=1882918 RepID=UPI0015610047|nr:ribonuclease P protein component [Pajaroellobacter abortibovis]